jgi:hypothetical protein
MIPVIRQKNNWVEILSGAGVIFCVASHFKLRGYPSAFWTLRYAYAIVLFDPLTCLACILVFLAPPLPQLALRNRDF